MAHPAAEREKAIKAVEAIFERYKLVAAASPYQCYDAHVMSTIKILDASSAGTVTYEFTIDERYSNINGVMHGGAAGVIFDMCTTTALGPLAKPGFWDFLGGVTRSLNISYLRGIPVNATVRIHSAVTQVGRTMAMIRGTMTSVDGETIYCTCEHHKVAVPTQKQHLEFKVPWDELWTKEGNELAKGEEKGKSKL